MIRMLLVAAVTTAAFAVPMAAADTVCGVKTEKTEKGTRATFGDVAASCVASGACEVAAYHRKAGAPNGWSHAVVLTREKADAAWRVLLTATVPTADRANPFILVVDRDPGIYVAPTRIKSSAGGNFQIDGANDVVAGFRPGKQLEWLYYEKDNPPEIHNAVMPLKGIKAALDWVDCVQQPKKG